MKMKLKPIRDHIVAKRLEEEEEKKVGGIIIPDSAKEKPMTAEVIAVGSGKLLEDGKTVPLEVKAGDKIIVGKYSGSEVKLDQTEYVILREDDVLGIIGK
jgi:chaperonin GroES